MACLYKRGGVYWIAYRVGGRVIQESLRTKNERLARNKRRKIEYELAVGLKGTCIVPRGHLFCHWGI